jgi:hypothetical protein
MYEMQLSYFKIGFDHNCIIYLFCPAQRRTSVAVNFLKGNISITFEDHNKHMKILCNKMHSLNLIDGAYIYHCALNS